VYSNVMFFWGSYPLDRKMMCLADDCEERAMGASLTLFKRSRLWVENIDKIWFDAQSTKSFGFVSMNGIDRTASTANNWNTLVMDCFTPHPLMHNVRGNIYKEWSKTY